MKAIEILMTEHQNILAQIGNITERVKSNDLTENTINEFVDFCENYADTYHHAKEENGLFLWMGEKNPMFTQGPIACMLKEHDQGREYLRSVKDLMKEGLEKNLEAIKKNLLGYAELLTSHIEKEDTVLYKMAEQADESTQDGDEKLMPLFNKIIEDNKDIVAKYF